MPWRETLYELICACSCDLPRDVDTVIRQARNLETPGSNARVALDTIIENIDLSRRLKRPLCQDTGTMLLYVVAPRQVDAQAFEQQLHAAVRVATENGILRQNCVDPVTGRNTGDNIAPGHPVIHWQQGPGDTVRVAMMLKGGGCENVGRQYALPHTELAAGRDLDGVRRCVLDAVQRAQGRGCSPGILGICVGGDRATGYDASKRQFLRALGDRSPIPELARLEAVLLKQCNALGIGPMGFGGRHTVLDVLIGSRHRVPASYYVTVSYMCWAYRRRRLTATPDGAVLSWDP